MWSNLSENLNLILGIGGVLIWVVAVAWYLYVSGIYNEWRHKWRHRNDGPNF